MKKLSIITAILAGFILIGCEGSNNSNNSDSNSSDTQSGKFIDSPVKGVYYKTSSGFEGYTNNEGKFKYKNGDKITFKVKGLNLGSTDAINIVTPYILADNNETKAINIALVLQNLDSDGNPNNGIDISSENIDLSDINISEDTSSLVMKLENKLGSLKIDVTKAKENLEKSVAKEVNELDDKTFKILKQMAQTKEWNQTFLESGVEFYDVPNKDELKYLNISDINDIKPNKITFKDGFVYNATKPEEKYNYYISYDKKTLTMKGDNWKTNSTIESIDAKDGIIITHGKDSNGFTYKKIIYVGKKAFENATNRLKQQLVNKTIYVVRRSDEDYNKWVIEKDYFKDNGTVDWGIVESTDSGLSGTVPYKILGFSIIAEQYNGEIDVYTVIKKPNTNYFEQLNSDTKAFYSKEEACKYYKQVSGNSCSTN